MTETNHDTDDRQRSPAPFDPSHVRLATIPSFHDGTGAEHDRTGAPIYPAETD